MNKQTVVLLLVAALLFIPTGTALKAFNIDPIEIINQEAGTAYCVAWEEPKVEKDVKPSPVQTTCDKCRGTKQVRSPDNITNLPCPCGAACKCQPMRAEPEVVVRDKQILLITATKWCSWCRIIDENVLPALEVMNWKISKTYSDDDKSSHIQVIDYDSNTELVKRFNPKGEDWSLPTFILIEDGKETNRWAGYLNGFGVGKFWDKGVITTDDVKNIGYTKPSK